MAGERQRHVRSFVKRPGRLTPAQRRALDELGPRFLLDWLPERVEPAAVFGRDAPLMVEIGFGNGDSLVELARELPAYNVLGIEVHEPGVGHCLLVADRAGLAHFRVSTHDATEVLSRQLPAHCVARLNLYFPDPWPKKRHHKRRIVQPRFLDLVDRCLAADGTLHIATDWADYAGHIDRVLSDDGRFTCEVRREHGGDRPLQRPPTKFERRGLKLGHRIVDWRWRRAGP